MLLALQIDSGRAQVMFDRWSGPHMLHTVLEPVVVRALNKARERGVRIVTEGMDCVLWIKAHDQQLVQIFGRILDNAIRFSPEGGEVRVSVSRDGDRARVSIADLGPGLTPDEIEAAFDRLRQINRAQQEQQGVGLSLSLVRSLVTIQGGEISVESQPGSGSTFSVAFPEIDPAA